MAIAEMFLWWYTQGWRVFMTRAKNWFSSITDFFSMDSLIRTLFKPYRQISAETASSGSFDLRFHMFLDRLISRCVGFVSRLFLLLLGCITIILGGLLCLIFIILWPFLPFFPVAGVILGIIGVTL